MSLERKDKIVYGGPTNMNNRKTKQWLFYLAMHWFITPKAYSLIQGKSARLLMHQQMLVELAQDETRMARPE